MLYSYKNHYPTPLPNRIRLPDGRTRTDSKTFSEAELLAAGYVLAPDPPALSEHERLIWDGTSWRVIKEESPEPSVEEARLELQKLVDQKLEELEWRYSRYYRLQRLGVQQIDNIVDLDAYSQKLIEIRNQENPFIVDWPTLT